MQYLISCKDLEKEMRTKRDVAEAMSLFVCTWMNGAPQIKWRQLTTRKKINDNGLKYLKMYEKRAKVRKNSRREHMNKKLYEILVPHFWEVSIFKTGKMPTFTKHYNILVEFSSCPSFHILYPEIYTV